MHCAKKGEEEKKTDIKGTVPARLEAKLASNKTGDSTKLQVLRALITGVDETTRLSSRFFFFPPLFHHLANSSKKHVYFGTGKPAWKDRE